MILRLGCQGFCGAGVKFERRMRLAADGIVIDLDEQYNTGNAIAIIVYKVGDILNLDILLRDIQKYKENASEKYTLQYDDKEWSLFRDY